MKKALKLVGKILLGLLVVVLLSGTALYIKGGSALEQKYPVVADTVDLDADSLSVAHGARLVGMLGCTDCHGGDLSGGIMIDEAPFRVVASNLTSGRGGVGAEFSVEDFNRALRQGVRPDGTPLIIMPAKAYHGLADTDAAAIIGFIKSLPPVDNELPKTTLKPLGRLLAASGQFDVGMEVTEEEPSLEYAPATAATVEFGQYHASIICAYCHQKDFTGGVAMGPGPLPSNIRSYGKLPVAEFISTLRTGVTPGGRVLDPIAMPIPIFAHWTDEELTAIHMYLATL